MGQGQVSATLNSALEFALPPEKLALLLGLSFFFGLAFEEYYARDPRKRPGGVRTFPLLALAGAGLYLIESTYSIAFSVGLLVIGAWLYTYYQYRWSRGAPASEAGGGLIIPVCNLLAYLLGPIVLSEPHWVSIAITVSAVLLLGARERLHSLAKNLPSEEIITAGKFLVLTGIILPLLPNHPVTQLSSITPHQLWIAVIVVSTLSYGSYLVRRYISADRGLMVAAVLGGLYSSTATTVVLAKQGKVGDVAKAEIRAGIVLATALMYLRLAVMVAVFNFQLAASIAPYLFVLFTAGLLLALSCYFFGRNNDDSQGKMALQRNPLELNAALLFAGLFVVISLASTWARSEFGRAGIYGLAAIVGVTDIDPFVLSLAQGGVSGLATITIETAILISASSNNLLKAAYAVFFFGAKDSALAAASLSILSLGGFAMAYWIAT